MTVIKLSAYNQTTEPVRLDRLGLVAACLRETATPILELRDHKGCLSVNWAERPSTADVMRAGKAWEMQCEYQVNHFVRGEPFLWDYEDQWDGK
jgi:hypothetical protein